MSDESPTDPTSDERHPPELWWNEFLDALATTGRVAEACRVVARDRSTAYQHRFQYPEFAAAWEKVERQRDQHLADNLMERLRDGVEEDCYYNGEVVGKRTVYNEAAALKFLAMRKPENWSERRYQPELQNTGEQHQVKITFAPQPAVPPDTTQED